MTFEPKEAWEVDTPHGLGLVLYVRITELGKSIFCVANRKDGQLRPYEIQQLRLTQAAIEKLNRAPHPSLPRS